MPTRIRFGTPAASLLLFATSLTLFLGNWHLIKYDWALAILLVVIILSGIKAYSDSNRNI